MPMNLKDEIVAGESYSLEFKRVPNEEREKYLKTVVAFANGKGGRILFGVANDRTVVGIPNERYVEGWGSGFLRMNEELSDYGARPVEIEDAGIATRLNVYRVAANTPEDNHEGNEGNCEPNGTNGGTKSTNRKGRSRRITGASVSVTAPLTAPVNEPVTSAKTLLRVIRENPGRRKHELVALTGLRPWTVKRLLEGMLKGKVEYRGACRNGGYFVVDENLKA